MNKKHNNKYINEYGHKLKHPPKLAIYRNKTILEVRNILRPGLNDNMFYNEDSYPKISFLVFKVLEDKSIELSPGKKNAKNIARVENITFYNDIDINLIFKKPVKPCSKIILDPHIDNVKIVTNLAKELRFTMPYIKPGIYKCTIVFDRSKTLEDWMQEMCYILTLKKKESNLRHA